MTEAKTIAEREYTIPLRENYRHVARYKKTPKAVKTVKEFLARHMKVYDRDLNKIKVDRYLNEYLWFRGIKKPPYKVKVKAVKDGEVVRVELAELPEKLKFKKSCEEKRSSKAREFLEKKKTTMQKAKESLKKPEETKIETAEEKKEEFKDENKDGVDDKLEEKEKKEAVKESVKEFEKAQHKKEKHKSKIKTPTQERRDRTTSSPAY